MRRKKLKTEMNGSLSIFLFYLLPFNGGFVVGDL